MRIGDTFLRRDSDPHLWVVLSDPAQERDRVLIVNMTTLTNEKERVCVLSPEDHGWIRHSTCINYGDAIVTTDELLEKAKAAGALIAKRALTDTVLRLILEGAAKSERLSLENADILIDQGLLDC